MIVAIGHLFHPVDGFNGQQLESNMQNAVCAGAAKHPGPKDKFFSCLNVQQRQFVVDIGEFFF
jgi:hypothetical protein